MKYFAFFLPQFHEIPENDEWWGKGFTEWVNVKRAKSLYKGHIQPVHPLNNHYYNLLSKDVVLWQNDLMKQYGIDGMIYYHYWFKGKLLLEKPAENLLKWADIDQPFFFCWANHSWKRTWNGTKEVLMPMEYGNKEDWEKHYKYLRQFFFDSRYEKVDNKPLLMLFKSSFDEKLEMMSYFNERCKDDGFAGIAVIETYHGEESVDSFRNGMTAFTKYIFYREPAIQKATYTDFHRSIVTKLKNRIGRMRIIHKPEIISGEKLIKNKIRTETTGKDIAHGIWFEWDNTPRHEQRGYVITPYKKDYFIEFSKLIKADDYLFINAWNEWCEGMMLEPTEENKYKYLEWIKEAKEGI